MVEALISLFPRLRDSAFAITSPPDEVYNCIAWVAGDTQRRWWPGLGKNVYWPPGIVQEENVAAFQAAFATLGYIRCEEANSEPGIDKLALFATADGTPTHAARQLPHGRWTSKFGELEDIEHELHSLEGAAYGTVVLFMKRPRPVSVQPSE